MKNAALVVFTVVFVLVKQVNTNLTTIPIAFVCEKFVYEDGTTIECVVKNRSVCGNLLLDSIGSDRCHYQAENEGSIRQSDISTNDQ